MALPPSRPADWEAARINPGDPACTIQIKLVLQNRLAIELFGWMFNDDGTFTQDFLDGIGASSSGISAPTGVAATSDRTTDITVTWNAVSNAAYYQVYRGATADTSAMTLVADNVTSLSYIDTGVGTDQTFWYAVRAYGTSQISELSTAASGKRPSSSTPSDPVVDDFTASSSQPTKSILVPSGKTAMEVQMWGPGGNGGGKYDGTGFIGIGSLTSPIPNHPGGGGASGSFYRVTAITVVAGDTLVLAPGLGGAGEGLLFKDELFSAVHVKVTGGGSGGNGSSTADGTPGAVPASEGTNNFPTGTPDGVNSTVGNPGVGTTGGAAVSYSGRSAGAGAAGNTTNADTVTGSPGRIRVIFT